MKMIKVLVTGSVYDGEKYLSGEVMLTEESAKSLAMSGHVKILPEEKPVVVEQEPVVVEEKIEVSEIPLVETEEKPRSKGKKS